MKREVIISGFGGQGLMFLGKLLAQAALLEDKFVSWIPSYGSEMRGGTAHCYVCISSCKIASPYVEKPDILVAMNQPSLDKFEKSLKEGGILIANESLVEKDFIKRGDIETYVYPLTDIANSIGDIRVANAVDLGVLLKIDKDLVKEKQVIEVLKKRLTNKRILELNLNAVRKGEGLC